MNIKIVTDSTADIPKALIDEYEIEVLPLTVHFNDKEYRDKIDLTPDEFYQKLLKADTLPYTSQVNPSAFEKTYKNILEKYDRIISIHISSDLSGTYQSAVMAKNSLKDERICVIDSRTATLSLGMIVLEASKYVRMGLNADEIVKNINEYKNELNLLIVVDTLKYLKKGGRLTGTQAMIGEMLNIKPILTVKDGKVVLLDKVRGHKKALNRIIEIMQEKGKELENQKIGIANAKSLDMALELKRLINDKFGTNDFIEAEAGCVIATHVGPGAYGVVFR